MAEIAENQMPVAELDHRSTGTLDVTLFWDRRRGSLIVQLIDWGEDGEDFTIPVGDAPPLDVFYHPFAYGALADVAGRR